MDHTFDFESATLVDGPHRIRDGGSVSIVVEVQGLRYGIRYAGGFSDALSGVFGTLEITSNHRPKDHVYCSQEAVIGLDELVKRNGDKFSGFAHLFLEEKDDQGSEKKQQIQDVFRPGAKSE